MTQRARFRARPFAAAVILLLLAALGPPVAAQPSGCPTAVPIEQVRAGMRGTGSKDLKYNDVFIPEHHAVDQTTSFQAGPWGAPVHPNCYLYDVPFAPYFSSWLLGPVIGCTEGAYDAYLSGTLEDYTYPEAQIAEAMKELAAIQP